MSMFVDKPLTLIERKKQQWAREREELSGFYAPWSSPPQHCHNKSYRNNKYDVFKSMNNNPEEYEAKSIRRQSLPPLYSNNNNNKVISEKEISGETSGYGSDNPVQIWCQSGYESSAVGGGGAGDISSSINHKWKEEHQKFWESKDTPNWVKRGLETDREIVVANSSPAESPQQYDMEQAERPYTGQSSNFNKTYIRGQNVPLDSSELAERERRRQIALAHQEAIKQQLEEREKRRKEERERRIREEREEELRIEREQEIERKRKENELRILKEKQDRERKRNEAIHEALKSAEKEAELEKIKIKKEKQNNININENENINNKADKDSEITNKIHNNILKEDINIKQENKVNNVEQEQQQQAITAAAQMELTTPQQQEQNNLLEILKPTQEHLNNQKIANKSPSLFTLTPRDMTLVFQAPMDTLQNMQYVLVSSLNSNNNNSCCASTSSSSSAAVPIAVPIIRSPTPLNSSARTENRILTPTRYRNNNKNKKLVDSSTQTDSDIIYEQKLIISQNNKDNYDNNNRRISSNNKGRISSRSEERVEDRPKWGANCPPTRYLKQSEKDPLYQRRKMRQKLRADCNKYDSKNSSDESRAASPRIYRKKNYVEKKRRARWGKYDIFPSTFRAYQSIIPLESDKEQIYYKCECCCTCSKNKSDDLKADILRIEQKLPDCGIGVGVEVLELDKVRLLHDDLIQKQERWENSPRTPSLSSSTTRNTTENN